MNEITEKMARAVLRDRALSNGFSEEAIDYRFVTEIMRLDAHAARVAYEEALADAGFVIVPREPSERAIGVGWQAFSDKRGSNVQRLAWAYHTINDVAPKGGAGCA